MSVPSFVSDLESPTLGAQLGLVSSVEAFAEAVQSLGATRAALTHIASKGPDLLLDRLERLVAQTIDPRYNHPDDIPIAAYLLILHLGGARNMRATADKVLAVPNSWWAQRVAAFIVHAASNLASVIAVPMLAEKTSIALSTATSSASIPVTRIVSATWPPSVPLVSTTESPKTQDVPSTEPAVDRPDLEIRKW